MQDIGIAIKSVLINQRILSAALRSLPEHTEKFITNSVATVKNIFTNSSSFQPYPFIWGRLSSLQVPKYSILGNKVNNYKKTNIDFSRRKILVLSQQAMLSPVEDNVFLCPKRIELSTWLVTTNDYCTWHSSCLTTKARGPFTCKCQISGLTLLQINPRSRTSCIVLKLNQNSSETQILYYQ